MVDAILNFNIPFLTAFSALQEINHHNHDVDLHNRELYPDIVCRGEIAV